MFLKLQVEILDGLRFKEHSLDNIQRTFRNYGFLEHLGKAASMEKPHAQTKWVPRDVVGLPPEDRGAHSAWTVPQSRYGRHKMAQIP